MDIVIAERGEAARLVADAVGELVAAHPTAVFGLATGSSPLALYGELASRRRSGDLPSVERTQAFALDEYLGLGAEDPQCYRSTLERIWAMPLGVPVEQVHVPTVTYDSVATAGSDYEAQIRAAGGIDVQFAGIGGNGHLGFNEPGSSLTSRTRVKTLTEQTRRDNSVFFERPEQVPTHCITQGLGTILESRHLVVLAFGAAKAAALAAAVEGPLTSSVPASVVQLHRSATIIVDAAASALLAHQDEYRWAWERRLGGQKLSFSSTTAFAG